MGLTRRSARSSVVAVLFALSFAIPAVAADAAANLSRIRIDNFGMVNANYYRGAQPKGRDYADLAALGVKTVIDLTDDDADPSEPAMVKSAGMKSIRIPMNTRRPPTKDELRQFLNI